MHVVIVWLHQVEVMHMVTVWLHQVEVMHMVTMWLHQVEVWLKIPRHSGLEITALYKLTLTSIFNYIFLVI